MEIALIWSCALSCALLVMALTVAQASRWPGPRGTALITVVGLVLLVASVPMGFLFYFSHLAARGALPLIALPTLLLLAGGAAIVALGRASLSPGLAPRAANWPRARLAAVLLVVLAILATSARNALLSAQQTIDTRRAELISLERLWWPGVPPSLNAAPLYQLAAQQLVPLEAVAGARVAFDKLWGTPAAQVNAPELAEWIRRNEAALALAIEGTQRPGYASVEDALWRSDPLRVGRQSKILKLEMQREPSLADLELNRRRIGDLLRTRSILRVYAGQLSLAVQDANALLALAEQTDSPRLRPERLLEKLLGAPGLTVAALDQLRLPRGEGLTIHLQRALLRSEHQALDSLGLFSSGIVPRPGVDPIDRPVMLGIGLFCTGPWSAEVERYFDEAWRALYAPPAERLRGVRQAKTRLLEMIQNWLANAGSLTQAFEARVRDEAERSCAEVGLALARYRLGHGRWPERLEALVPDYLVQVPVDPFDGAPLRYRASADSARVSSAGDVEFTVPLPH